MFVSSMSKKKKIVRLKDAIISLNEGLLHFFFRPILLAISTGPTSIKHGLRTTECGLGVTAKRRILPGTYSLKSRANKKRFVSFARWSVLSVVLRVGHYETKVLNWPEEKAQDSASPDRFIIFLMRCKSAMELAANT